MYIGLCRPVTAQWWQWWPGIKYFTKWSETQQVLCTKRFPVQKGRYLVPPPLITVGLFELWRCFLGFYILLGWVVFQASMAYLLAWECKTPFSCNYPQHIPFSVSWAFLASFYRLDLIFIITLKRPSAILITHYQLLSVIALTVSLSVIWQTREDRGRQHAGRRRHRDFLHLPCLYWARFMGTWLYRVDPNTANME